jgi:hypothetical protein
MKNTKLKASMGAALFVLCLCGAARGEDETVAVTFKEKFSMQIPKSWKQGEAAGMKAFQAKSPKQGDDPEDGELAVFVFPNGGGVDANLKRWTGQMGGDDSLKNKTTVKTASGKDAVVAELEGTYSAMSPAGGKSVPKAGYKMLGAIILTDNGEVYIKLTGPKGSIDAQKAAFDKMIQSFK